MPEIVNEDVEGYPVGATPFANPYNPGNVPTVVDTQAHSGTKSIGNTTEWPNFGWTGTDIPGDAIEVSAWVYLNTDTNNPLYFHRSGFSTDLILAYGGFDISMSANLERDFNNIPLGDVFLFTGYFIPSVPILSATLTTTGWYHWSLSAVSGGVETPVLVTAKIVDPSGATLISYDNQEVGIHGSVFSGVANVGNWSVLFDVPEEAFWDDISITQGEEAGRLKILVAGGGADPSTPGTTGGVLDFEEGTVGESIDFASVSPLTPVVSGNPLYLQSPNSGLMAGIESGSVSQISLVIPVESPISSWSHSIYIDMERWDWFSAVDASRTVLTDGQEFLVGLNLTEASGPSGPMYFYFSNVDDNYVSSGVAVPLNVWMDIIWERTTTGITLRIMAGNTQLFTYSWTCGDEVLISYTTSWIRYWGFAGYDVYLDNLAWEFQGSAPEEEEEGLGWKFFSPQPGENNGTGWGYIYTPAGWIKT